MRYLVSSVWENEKIPLNSIRSGILIRKVKL